MVHSPVLFLGVGAFRWRFSKFCTQLIHRSHWHHFLVTFQPFFRHTYAFLHPLDLASVSALGRPQRQVSELYLWFIFFYRWLTLWLKAKAIFSKTWPKVTSNDSRSLLELFSSAVLSEFLLHSRNLRSSWFPLLSSLTTLLLLCVSGDTYVLRSLRVASFCITPSGYSEPLPSSQLVVHMVHECYRGLQLKFFSGHWKIFTNLESPGEKKETF